MGTGRVLQMAIFHRAGGTLRRLRLGTFYQDEDILNYPLIWRVLLMLPQI